MKKLGSLANKCLAIVSTQLNLIINLTVILKIRRKEIDRILNQIAVT